MTIEDVARQYQFREGLELVDYAEVGLPVFRLTLEAVTMARRTLPTIDEFVMRSVSMGENTVEGIATFLGLESELVDASVRLLRTGGLFGEVEAADRATRQFGLTDSGRRVLAEGAQYEPQEEMLVIDFDGIRRRPIWLGSENLLRASELNDAGAVEIRPYPATPPDVSDLRIASIATVIRRQVGNAFSRDILALKKVVRRANVFRSAVALVFRNPKTKEVQVGFVVGGQVAEDYELDFASRGGPQRTGFLRQVQETEGGLRLRRRLGPQIWNRLPEARVLAERRASVQEARDHHEALLSKADAAGGTDRLGRRELGELAAVKERLEAADKALEEFEIRPLAPYEQRELLRSALKDVQQTLLISSVGLSRYVVDGFFLRLVDLAIERGARITIATTLRQTEERGRNQSFDPLSELQRRANHSLSLTLVRLKRAETLFSLVKDRDWAVLSNRPFLGDRTRRPTLFCVNGIVSHEPSVVERVAEIFGESLDVARQ